MRLNLRELNHFQGLTDYFTTVQLLAGKDFFVLIKYIYICIHKWFSNIKLNKSAQWVERLNLCRKRVNEYSNN